MLGHAHLAGKVSLFCLLDSSLVFVFSFQNRFLHPFKRFHGRKSRIKARDFSPSVWMDAGGGRQERTDQVEGRSQRVTSHVIKTLNPGAFSLWPQDERMFQSPPPLPPPSFSFSSFRGKASSTPHAGLPAHRWRGSTLTHLNQVNRVISIQVTSRKKEKITK